MEVLLFIHIVLFFLICHVQINHLNINEWHIIVLLIVQKLHQYVSKHN